MSQQAWGKGRALLEALGLSAAQIAECYGMHPLNEKEAVQHGLQVWMEGGANTTWEALLEAMETAEIDVQQREGFKEELRSNTGDSHGLMVASTACGKEGWMCHCVFVCCPAGGVHVVNEEELLGSSATAGEHAHHLHCTALHLVWHTVCGGLVTWCTHEHC